MKVMDMHVKLDGIPNKHTFVVLDKLFHPWEDDSLTVIMSNEPDLLKDDILDDIDKFEQLQLKWLTGCYTHMKRPILELPEGVHKMSIPLAQIVEENTISKVKGA